MHPIKRLAFITGATGLIGGEIAIRLARNGWHVFALVRPTEKKEPADRLRERLLQSAVTEITDLTRILAIPGDATQPNLGLPTGEDWIPTIVIHCAADTSFVTEESPQHPNIVATEQIIRFIKDRSLETKLILFSTAAVNLGASGAVISEDTPCAGYHNSYTISKAIAEQRFKESGLLGHIVRPSIVLSRSVNNRAMARSMLWVIYMLSELGAFPIDPNARLDFVPVEFVADATLQLILKPKLDHTTYHISSGISSAITCQEIVDSLQELLPSLKSAKFLGPGAWPDDLLYDPQKRRIIKAVNYYLPFINANVVYSDQRLRSEIGSVCPRCPKPTEYLPKLMRQVNLSEAYDECCNP